MEEHDTKSSERLERVVARIETTIEEHARRLRALEEAQGDIRSTLHDIATTLARLEARLDGFRHWQSLAWAIIGLILGGFVASGFELLKR